MQFRPYNALVKDGFVWVDKEAISVMLHCKKCSKCFLCNLIVFQHDIEKRDIRGRTALMLAVTLGFLEMVKILLSHDADVNCENSDGWTGKLLGNWSLMMSVNIHEQFTPSS